MKEAYSGPDSRQVLVQFTYLLHVNGHGRFSNHIADANKWAATYLSHKPCRLALFLQKQTCTCVPISHFASSMCIFTPLIPDTLACRQHGCKSPLVGARHLPQVPHLHHDDTPYLARALRLFQSSLISFQFGPYSIFVPTRHCSPWSCPSQLHHPILQSATLPQLFPVPFTHGDAHFVLFETTDFLLKPG